MEDCPHSICLIVEVPHVFAKLKNSISNEIISAEDGWEDAALKAFRKKYKDGISEDTKERLKQKNFLHNRGFSFKEIESVFS